MKSKIISSIMRFIRKIISKIDIEFSSKIMYRAFVGSKLNLENPVTFNEKLCWLKLRVFPNYPIVIECADKYRVPEYLKQRGFGHLLVKQLAVWNNVNEIDWDILPNKFVLKCNHGCGYNIICVNKEEFDKKKALKKLKKWMAEDFGLVSGEPHYSKIERKIICEEFLEGDIKDYKFFCFNGVPQFFYIAETTGGDFHKMLCDFYLTNGEIADFYRLDHKRFDRVLEPAHNLSEMIDIASKLSSEFPFVRVDFMTVGDKLYFSELTFTPSAGIMPLAPIGTDIKLGKLLDIEQYKTAKSRG